MEEIGIVKEINGIRAIISVQKQDSCGYLPRFVFVPDAGSGRGFDGGL